jgi:hypothetical protein
MTLKLEDYRKEMKGIYSTSVNKHTIDGSSMVYKTMGNIVANIDQTAKILNIIKPIYNFRAAHPVRRFSPANRPRVSFSAQPVSRNRYAKRTPAANPEEGAGRRGAVRRRFYYPDKLRNMLFPVDRPRPDHVPRTGKRHEKSAPAKPDNAARITDTLDAALKNRPVTHLASPAQIRFADLSLEFCALRKTPQAIAIFHLYAPCRLTVRFNNTRLDACQQVAACKKSP